MNIIKKSSLAKVTTLAALMAASSITIASQQWPDLPEGIKNGVGVQVGSVVYVGLGSAGDSFYALDVEAKNPQWKKLADFEGSVPDGAAAAAADDKIYVLGGSGKVKSSDKAPVVLDTVHAYDIKKNEWSTVKTQTPVGMLGASAYALNDKEIVILGGYNKDKFDKYLSDILSIDQKKDPQQWQTVVDDFMGMKPENYQWNKQIQIYNVATNSWSVRGESPYLPNCGAALVGNGSEITLISGEIKPGLRTPMVKSVTIKGEEVKWKELAQLPTPVGAELQEGVAGAYAGMSNGTLLVAGGANFHGARAQSIRGQWFAHNGFAKAWNPEIYAYRNGGWQQTETRLPEGLAYGASFTTGKGMLMVGGEGPDGKPRNDVYMINYNGTDVEIES